jgi:D-glycero-D-manno-heptose 1,7-bisphosphate phosphatase
MTRAVFLDRDGVINQKPREGLYVTRWEDFHILPGVAESVALLNGAGFRVIVVTNQRCIAKGLMTIAELEEMHRRMLDSLARAGATIDGVYYCPHEIEPSCDCRKPAPGMLLDAARSRGIDLAASWMIGDSDIDIEAGRNAGCKTVRLLETNEMADEAGRHGAATNGADIVAPSLLNAIRQILSEEVPAQACSRRTQQAQGADARPARDSVSQLPRGAAASQMKKGKQIA